MKEVIGKTIIDTKIGIDKGKEYIELIFDDNSKLRIEANNGENYAYLCFKTITY
jgi:hypothetical protein